MVGKIKTRTKFEKQRKNKRAERRTETKGKKETMCVCAPLPRSEPGGKQAAVPSAPAEGDRVTLEEPLLGLGCVLNPAPPSLSDRRVCSPSFLPCFRAWPNATNALRARERLLYALTGSSAEFTR